MEDRLLTDINGKDTDKAIADLEAHKLPSLFSYRQAYFVGTKAQLAKDEARFAKEKAEFGLSVNEAAWNQATSEYRQKTEEIFGEVEGMFPELRGRIKNDDGYYSPDEIRNNNLFDRWQSLKDRIREENK